MDSAAKRIPKILSILAKTFPRPRIPLDQRNAFELTVATILSAQCTDERVNQTTPALFKRFPDSGKLARAKPADVEKMIYSTGFYRAKAKNIIGMALAVEERFSGRIPQTMEELVTLPGVARKTANVVLGGAFGKTEGIVVDTHVTRVAQRLALTRNQDPVKIEQDLMQLVPRASWIDFGLQLIFLGRKICFARKPNCAGCPLNRLCPAAFKA